ncbi:MAG TPA: dienelactone hydrolase family protein [Opitutaceae bacterium]|nr:dienelactone hydrolase family protein [Opitutaceae bacterium]
MKIHEGLPILRGGADFDNASAAIVLVHGRGGSAEDMMGLGEELIAGAAGVALLAPQAAGGTWYPQRFLAPLEQNEPHLSSALGVVGAAIESLAARSIPRERVLLVGFSQGACLALEFAARNPARFGGVVGLSGALIGPAGIERELGGSLQGVPVFLGCGDLDSHIPVAGVRESAAVFRKLGADVTECIYPRMPHTVNEDEIATVRTLVKRVAAAGG